MTPVFKAGLLATTMAAVALVPAAGVFTLVSVDAAYAKGEGNGNGNGGGNGNGNGNGGQSSEARGGGQNKGNGGGRPEWAGSRGNGGNGNAGGRSEAARGGSDPVSNFIRSLTGEDKREARQQARAEARAARRAPTEYAPVASIQPGKRPARNSDMHPSQLGNMNGALNANINAVLAHVRNGNVNGPVGSLAALAVADAALADAERIVNEDRLADLLVKYEYDSVQDYYDELAGDDEMARYEDLDAAIAALGSSPELGETYEFTPPSDEEVAAAEGSLEELMEARAAAESGILSLWNKNGDPEPAVITTEEQALLDDLRGRLSGHEDEIDAAIMDAATRSGAELPEEVEEEVDEETACEDLEGCEAPEPVEDEVAAAD